MITSSKESLAEILRECIEAIKANGSTCSFTINKNNEHWRWIKNRIVHRELFVFDAKLHRLYLRLRTYQYWLYNPILDFPASIFTRILTDTRLTGRETLRFKEFLQATSQRPFHTFFVLTDKIYTVTLVIRKNCFECRNIRMAADANQFEVFTR